MKLERMSAAGLSFNSDGTLLACSADTVTLWHVSTGERVTEITVEGGNPHYFSCVAFSPDDRFIAAGHSAPDDTFVWNLQYALEHPPAAK